MQIRLFLLLMLIIALLPAAAQAGPLLHEGPPAANLVVISDSIRRTSSGDYLVMGLLQNNGSHDAVDVRLAIYGYDATGNLVDSSKFAKVLSNAIAKGKTAPFAANFTRRDVQIDKYRVEVSGVQDLSDNISKQVVRVLQSTQGSDGKQPYIIGAVRNDGRAATSGVAVNLTLLDGAGKVVGVGQYRELAPFSLAQKQQAGFKVTLDTETPLQWTSVRLDISVVYRSYGDFKAKGLSISQHSLVKDKAGNAVVRGIIYNNSDRDAIAVLLYATAYDKNGNVVAVGSITKHEVRLFIPGKHTANFELVLGVKHEVVVKYNLLVIGWQEQA